MSKKGKYEKDLIAAMASLVIIIGAIIGISIGISLHLNSEQYKAVKSETPPAPEVIEGLDNVEYGQGEIKVDGQEIKTVESVESDTPVTKVEDQECGEDEECGRGATFPIVDTSTPQAFLNQTLGGCYDIDGHYNEQCWDYAALYFLNYAGHTFYTCGTGAAKGAIADGCWQKNATDKFTMIWDATKVKAGDWVVFNSGTYGHVGFATGNYNNGYVTLAGQNQGGGLCPGSTMGAKVNIINISMKYFAGAFRPNIYITPEPPTPDPEPEPKPDPKPAPAPTVDNCKTRKVNAGDTMGAIMKECEGKVEWGSKMDAYADSWVSEKTGKTVFYGWTHGTGYGLLAGDTISRK